MPQERWRPHDELDPQRQERFALWLAIDQRTWIVAWDEPGALRSSSETVSSVMGDNYCPALVSDDPTAQGDQLDKDF